MWTPQQYTTYTTALHTHTMAYTLLTTTITCLGPAALPHVGALSTMLGGALRGVRVAAAHHPPTEAALYGALEALLVVGGAGAGRALAAEVVEVLQWRLYGAGVKHAAGGALQGAYAAPTPPAKRQKTGRKGRRGGGGGGIAGSEGLGTDAPAVQRTLHMRAPLGTPLPTQHAALQQALLRVLGVLFRVAGAVLPAATRLQLDALVCHFATSVETAVQAVQGDGQGDVGSSTMLFAQACRCVLVEFCVVDGWLMVLCV